MRNDVRSRFPLLLIVALAACAKKENAPEPAPPAAAAPPTVHVTATDYAFQAPDTLPAGLTSFHLMNNGKEPHHLVLMKLNEGQKAEDLAKMDMRAPIPANLVLLGGPNPAAPSGAAEATVNLKPGRYAMYCMIPAPDGQPHLMKGMVRELVVTPAQTTVAEPTADDTLKLGDYSFEFSKPLSSGHHVLRVEDAGSQPHELVIVKLEPGKTVEQFVQWTEKMQGPPPGSFLGGVSPISAGEVSFITLDLSPGEYGLMCFFPDAKDMKPHFMHGMMKQVNVM